MKKICAKTRNVAVLKYKITIAVAVFIGGLLEWTLQRPF